MTGWIKTPGGWLQTGSPAHLEQVWQEFVDGGRLPVNFVDRPTSPTAPYRELSFNGRLHPLVLDAWAHRWHATYQAVYNEHTGYTWVAFTYQGDPR